LRSGRKIVYSPDDRNVKMESLKKIPPSHKGTAEERQQAEALGGGVVSLGKETAKALTVKKECATKGKDEVT